MKILNIRVIIIFILSFVPTEIFAQYDYENLVFEGGSVRGVAYAGVAEHLDSMEILADIKRVAGTSAGALAATALALKYTPTELKNALDSVDFESFNDGDWLVFGGLIRLFKRYGYYRGKNLSEWIGNLIAFKTGSPDITFGELHDKGYLDLYITGTSLNQQKLLIFSHETFPEMKVRDAVRISMSVPFYYKALVIDNNGTIIEKKNLDHLKNSDYHIMVDGGIVANLPISIFDHAKYNAGCTPAEDRCINNKTLAFKIDSEEQVELDQQGNIKKLAAYPVDGFKEFSSAFYTFSIESLNRAKHNEDDWQRTVFIKSGGIGLRVKNLDGNQKQLLFENGKSAVRAYFMNLSALQEN